MAHAALVSLEQTIDQILHHHRYSTSPLQRQLILSLDKYVISFLAFLEDFMEKARNLEGRMRDVANVAEDIIGGFMLKQIRPCCGCIAFTFFGEIMVEYELKKVEGQMESIAAEVVEMKNSTIIISKDEQLTDSSTANASSSSGVERIEMVGFDDDLMEIKGTGLVGGSPKLRLLAIVGMGGIGKTTLAKNAYDDQFIREHFQIRAWATVSQDYKVENILSSLLDAMKDVLDPRRNESENKGDRVYKTLKGRRYIIVLDDVWSRKVLDDVRNLFPDDENGSRIMLTTRLSDVAAYAKSSISHKMGLLNQNQSWNLFRQKVFAHHDRVSPELEKVGKVIARSCKGLPLAIVVIAGVVSSITKTPASWWKIAANIKEATSKDGQVDNILSLSYYHLPYHLRSCLLLAFPEDHMIRASELIRLWIAQGFLKSSPNGSQSQSQTLEEGAEEYLEDLVRRNLILVTETKSDGKIKSCSLHDMIRDTCIKLLKEEKNLRMYTSENTDQNPSSIRSMLRFDPTRETFEDFKLVRVFHAPDCRSYYPQILLKLLHLRYILIKPWYWYEITSSISDCSSIQTLVITKEATFIIPI